MREPGRNPTIRDVARVAGVSVATASRALGNYGRVSDETRARVQAATEEIGYRPNSVARSMITRRTNTIGVVCADISSPFFAGVVRGVTDEAKKAGFDILLVNTDEDVATEREAIALLMDKRVDGMVVSAADVCEVAHLATAQERGTPVVLIDRISSMLSADVVTVDDVRATELAVSHLLELGHRRIGILAELRIEREADWQTLLGPGLDRDRGELNASAARLLGYLRAHRAAGVPVDPTLVCRTGTYEVDGAVECARQLLSRSDRPSALVTIDNVMTVGGFRAVRELDLDLPGDLSFVGFDNLDWTTLVRPALTLVEQPVHEIGARAAQRLLERIAGDDQEPRRILLPTSFLVRGSTAPAAPAAP
ncbi:LacI family DNA-binding transcriptional regulator [Nocardioides sp. NPDC092400]|uniref:LacI family DNA-binding transcriptional regulator n=1 Tax=Nocardioides sp. NPDC092400 TaxID=3155196 RepID=UPI003424DD86